MKEVRFFVNGATPAPGGSKSAFPIYKRKGISGLLAGTYPGWKPSTEKLCPSCGFTGRVAMTDAGGERNKLWRQEVAKAAMLAMKQADLAPFTGPIELELIFQMPRPKSHYRSDGVRLRPQAPSGHVIRPDCTKLARSTEDALTGKAYLDDAQIVKQCHEKFYVGTHGAVGAWIVIKEIG
jgi:Holliday junction resolvase RusA-like endonuclease